MTTLIGLVTFAFGISISAGAIASPGPDPLMSVVGGGLIGLGALLLSLSAQP